MARETIMKLKCDRCKRNIDESNHITYGGDKVTCDAFEVCVVPGEAGNIDLCRKCHAKVKSLIDEIIMPKVTAKKGKRDPQE